MSRPLILNQLGPELAAALAAHPARPAVRDVAPGPLPWGTPDVDDADVLIAAPSPAWREATDQAPAGWPGRLRWIQVASTGVDWCPRWMLQGPVVTCGRGHNAAAIAEYVLAAMLLHEKRLDTIRVGARADWQRHALGTLDGRTLGLAGFGSIGQAIAARAAPFGMRIAAWRRSGWTGETGSLPCNGVHASSSLAELAASSDHLVLALPLTEETRHCVDRTLLDIARPGLHLVNIARGGLVDQPALLDALDDGRLGFATLDVAEPEPLPAGHPIYTHARIRLTPHVSWSGQRDGLARLAEQILANLTAYLSGGVLRDVVDPVRGY